MDSVLTTVFFILYLALLLLYALTRTGRRMSVSEFLSGPRDPAPYILPVSSLGTDVGFWLTAILPAVALSSANGSVYAMLLAVSLLGALVVLWFVFAKRLYIYGEILGKPETVTDFLTLRLKTATRIPRVYFGAVCTVFSFLCGVAALIFVARILSVLLSWDYTVCIAVAGFSLLLYLLAAGALSVYNIGFLQGLLFLLSAVLFVTFLLIDRTPDPGFSEQLSHSFQLLPPSSGTEGTQPAFFEILRYLTLGFCLTGTPSVLMKFLRVKERRSLKKHAVTTLFLFAVGAVGMLLICADLSAVSGQIDGGFASLAQLTGLLKIPFLRAFFCTALTLGLLGGVAVHLGTAFSELVRNIEPIFLKNPQRLTVRSLRVQAAVFLFCAGIVAALSQKDPTDLFLFAASCLTVVILPAVTFLLYRKDISALAVVTSSASGLLVTVLYRALVTDLFPLPELLPGLFVSFGCLALFGLSRKKASETVTNEYERMDLLARSTGDLYYHNPELNEDNINW